MASVSGARSKMMFALMVCLCRWCFCVDDVFVLMVHLGLSSDAVRLRELVLHRGAREYGLVGEVETTEWSGKGPFGGVLMVVICKSTG